MQTTPLIPAEAGEPIVCPSGLTVTVREMTVREERLLADTKLQRSGRFSTELLEACVTDILEPGPYQGGALDWRSVLQGDRFLILLAIRVATYGPKYDFRVSCGECRSPIRWRVDLCEDLELKPCPEESLEAFKAGEALETELGDAVIRFKLTTGIQEEAAAKLAGTAAATPLSAALKLRIGSVTRGGAELSKKEIGGWLEGLGLGAVRKLRAAFDAADCGVETELEIDCPTCQASQAIDLPFGRAFWMPEG